MQVNHHLCLGFAVFVFTPNLVCNFFAIDFLLLRNSQRNSLKLLKKTFSSHVNEAIRAVLNLSLLLFLLKDFTRTQKHQKHKDATKQKHNATNEQK